MRDMLWDCIKEKKTTYTPKYDSLIYRPVEHAQGDKDLASF